MVTNKGFFFGFVLLVIIIVLSLLGGCYAQTETLNIDRVDVGVWENGSVNYLPTKVEGLEFQPPATVAVTTTSSSPFQSVGFNLTWQDSLTYVVGDSIKRGNLFGTLPINDQVNVFPNEKRLYLLYQLPEESYIDNSGTKTVATFRFQTVAKNDTVYIKIVLQ